MTDPRVKQVKIKSGVVKRLAKEISMYEKEAEQQRKKIDKMKLDEPRDEYMIRKQEEVLQESLMMVPDSRRRLATAHADLKNVLDSEQDMEELEEYQLAKKIIGETESLLIV